MAIRAEAKGVMSSEPDENREPEGARTGSEQREPAAEEAKTESTRLVRLLKPVVIMDDEPGDIDGNVISPRFYNAFNYAILGKAQASVNMALGVTSPHRGDGKTLVAANLAVSLAVVQERDTVLVDINIATPTIHSIFGVRLAPGLVAALNGPNVHVCRTRVPRLHVLPAGEMIGSPIMVERMGASRKSKSRVAPPSLGIEQVAEFRNIVYSLREKFEFVIIDMPPLREPSIPVILAQQMDGLLVVVNAEDTKREDIDRMFRRVHDSQILGFVFNRASTDLIG
jgi:Mrp family chromosome partitioning ATPase